MYFIKALRYFFLVMEVFIERIDKTHVIFQYSETCLHEITLTFYFILEIHVNKCVKWH
jgi:hypothetical protein